MRVQKVVVGKCEEVSGVEREMEGDARWVNEVEVARRVIKWVNEVEAAQEEVDKSEQGGWEDRWGDVKGGKLDGELVAKARVEEIGYMKRRGIWRVVPQRECWERTGKAPIGVRWVDTN